MSTSNTQYHMMDWKEAPCAERSNGSRLTRVDAVFRYKGLISGQTAVHYQMLYMTEMTGIYEGFELFTGTFQGSEASVWFRHQGTFDEAGVDAAVETVTGTGTGSLTGRQLSFSVRFQGDGPYSIALEER